MQPETVQHHRCLGFLPDLPKPDSPKLGFRVRVGVSANRDWTVQPPAVHPSSVHHVIGRQVHVTGRDKVGLFVWKWKTQPRVAYGTKWYLNTTKEPSGLKPQRSTESDSWQQHHGTPVIGWLHRPSHQWVCDCLTKRLGLQWPTDSGAKACESHICSCQCSWSPWQEKRTKTATAQSSQWRYLLGCEACTDPCHQKASGTTLTRR